MAITLILWLATMAATGTRTIGVSLTSSSSADEYQFSAGSNPVAFALSTVLVVFYIRLFRTKSFEGGTPLGGVFLRFVAFWIDFVCGMMIVAPVLGMIPVIAEWKRTGAFQWAFERTTSAPSDNFVMGLIVVLTAAALVLYYAIPLTRNCPSPGTCIMGYRVVADNGVLTLDQAIWRCAAGLLAVMMAYIAPFVGRDRSKGKVWPDKLFRTHAITLQ